MRLHALLGLSLALVVLPACKSDREGAKAQSSRDAAAHRASREARKAAVAAIVRAELPEPNADSEAADELSEPQSHPVDGWPADPGMVGREPGLPGGGPARPEATREDDALRARELLERRSEHGAAMRDDEGDGDEEEEGGEEEDEEDGDEEDGDEEDGDGEDGDEEDGDEEDGDEEDGDEEEGDEEEGDEEEGDEEDGDEEDGDEEDGDEEEGDEEEGDEEEGDG